MGIYDREYYRDDGGGFLHGFASRGQIYKSLILANVVVYIIQIATKAHPHAVMTEDGLEVVGGGVGWFTELFQFRADQILHGQLWRLVTYSFLHDPNTPYHIIFNMLALWWFGSDVEDIYGPKEFLCFYFAAAVLGGVAQFLVVAIGIIPDLHLPGAIASPWTIPMIGASGAVNAVMMTFAMHYPTRSIYLMMIVPVPVILVVIFSVLQDLTGLLGNTSHGIAVACHLGGAAFGFLYYRYHWRVSNLLPGRIALPRFGARPKLRVYRPEPRPEPVTAAVPRSEPDAHLEEELDAVLEKVARNGRDSLTERENQILMRASEIYKQRRK